MALPHSPQFEHVVITGASSGLGAALARYYAAPGRLLSLGGRDSARLGALSDACRALGAVVEPMSVDVTDAEAMESWLLGRDDAAPVDLVVAGAGIGGAAVVTQGLPETGDRARLIMATNAGGVVNTVTPLLPRLIARRSGSVALIGSISGAIGLPQSPAYCASKAAVAVYGDALRRLLRQHGVRLTNVLPGFVDTPMSQSLDLGRPFLWTAEQAAQRIARDIAHGRGRSAFPWQLRLAIGLQSILPLAITDAILARSAR
jgi:NADP-dependent 3-hydroxy acid dehydrogenase YdfG